MTPLSDRASWANVARPEREYNHTEIEIHCWNPFCPEFGKRIASAILQINGRSAYEDGGGCWACGEPPESFSDAALGACPE